MTVEQVRRELQEISGSPVPEFPRADWARLQSGLIVNVSSGLGRLVLPFTGIYTATKWALEALTESAHYELAPLGIDVAPVGGRVNRHLRPVQGGRSSKRRAAPSALESVRAAPMRRRTVPGFEREPPEPARSKRVGCFKSHPEPRSCRESWPH